MEKGDGDGEDKKYIISSSFSKSLTQDKYAPFFHWVNIFNCKTKMCVCLELF